jgi:hypothetical protein
MLLTCISSNSMVSIANVLERCHISAWMNQYTKFLSHQSNVALGHPIHGSMRKKMGTSKQRSELMSALRTSKVHPGHDAVILVWHRTCIWLQYIIVIELSQFVQITGTIQELWKIFLYHFAAHYTTGWLIDHTCKSNKEITIVSWPNKLHNKMDFYIFYLINKLFIAKTGIHNK